MASKNNAQRTLDNHLTLHAWLNNNFGYKTTRDLLSDVAKLDEGFNPDGHTAICKFLMARPNLKPEIEAALPTYDANIKRHLSAINNRRTQPIVLRYFQYLSLLYTEIFLDWKFNRPGELLRQLNVFVQTRNDARAPSDAMDNEFTAADLEKLAFWMATGAGKTLIMHINYHQYLHYCKETLDHVVLITPNEGLSEQHMREMANSDIRCERFKVEGNRFSNSDNAVQVIEITKLVEEKTGEGESVAVEAFEGKNLIFADEGHKGSGGRVWRPSREKLAETGFTFEYSATFGQAVAAAKNADLVDEYGKAIVFDYSYRYFYGDGYGKNFRILNVKHDEETQTETLLLGNLLSFYAQCRYFEKNPETVQTYGLDAPLWAFVGSKVKGGKIRSDVLNVIRFLHRFLKNEKDWAIHTIAKIIDGNSGLLDDNGADVFQNRFNYIKDLDADAAGIYIGILNRVFHTDTAGALHLRNVRNAPGEIALKTTHGTKEFGLIYIGDTTEFKKLVENDDADINTDSEDVLTESLFSDINKPNSRINILIGAKKFIEGWDSWRVTAMGLLNIGGQEGSQIIQLFGRGVRLRGKDMSLKRSAALDGEHPPHLSLLETLNIFAVRANFMVQFRNYLMREGVPTEETVELGVPIKPNMAHLENRLYIPSVSKYSIAAKGQCVMLEANPGAIVTHTTQSVDIIGSSSQSGIRGERAEAEHQVLIPKKSLACLNWEKIHLQLLEYKQEKRFDNLIFDTEILKQIISPGEALYKLTVMNESEVVPTSQAELERLEELVLTLLCKYIAKFYRLIQKQWNSESVRLEPLKAEDPNFTDWKLSVPRKEAKDIDAHITYLIESGEMYGPGLTKFPNIHNDRHLYQPLLIIDSTATVLKTTPPALVESEKEFVEHLRRYVREQRETLLANKNVFLLRNQSRGKGIGFYENEGFYPDFILWILEGAKQRIVFIEPHGMVHEAIHEDNEKITLFERLKTLSEERFRAEHIEMDSFMISKTPLVELRKKHKYLTEEKFKELHILFPNSINPDYLAPIFQGS